MTCCTAARPRPELLPRNGLERSWHGDIAGAYRTRNEIQWRDSGTTWVSCLGIAKELQEHGDPGTITPPAATRRERTLARSLSATGFDFKPVGPQTDYFGPVTPCMADLTELLANLEKQNPLLHVWFNDRSVSNWMLFRTLLKMKLSAPGTH
jgi:hypothetical protein